MTRRLRDHEPEARPAPPRLREEGGQIGRLLGDANHAYGQGLDEPAAWRGLRARSERPRQRVALVSVTAGLAAAAVLLWLLPMSFFDQGSVIASASPEAAEPFGKIPMAERSVPWVRRAAEPMAKRDRPLPRSSRVAPAPTPLALPTGRSVLTDGSEIALFPHARAELRGRAGERTTIALMSGAVELKVAPQHERTFEVTTRTITFRVLGTRFLVSLERGETKLEVSEGTVAVVADDAVIARVTAGGRWSGPVGAAAARPAAAAPAPSDQPEPLAPAREASLARPRPAPPSPNADPCLALARRGRGRDAIQCLQPLSAGTGLSAEMAMYEIARLQRDVLGDVPAALGTLHDCAARFPHGSLQTEVRLSVIDLLARAGRAREALAESAGLLASAGGGERAAELHLLRGNLLRERVGDCDQAMREYADAERNGGAVGAEAVLGRAQCLERQGRTEEAQAAYRACIERGHTRTTAAARRRLEAMRTQ